MNKLKKIIIPKGKEIKCNNIILEAGDIIYIKEELKQLKEGEYSSYYKSELNNVLPIDDYGCTIKIKSSKGESKWLNVNSDFVKAFNEFVKKNII
jgi:hypothetical protein